MNAVIKTQGTYCFLENDYSKTEQDFDFLYDHLTNCVKTESPSQMLTRFRSLFIEGENYSEPTVQDYLKKMSNSQQELVNLSCFFSHCCQLFISHCYNESENQLAIVELLNLFKNLPSPDKKTHQLSKSWQKSINQFAQTSEYLKLERFVRVLNPRILSNAQKPQYLGDLLGRYPFLYKHCLLNNETLKDYRRLIGRIKTKRELIVEQELFKIVNIYQQKVDVARFRQSSSPILPFITQSVKNPTLLNIRELNVALGKFITLTQSEILKGQPINQLTNYVNPLSFKEFKNWLINYLMKDLDHLSHQKGLNQFFDKNILQLFSDFDSQPVTEFLILRTCNQLLNQLVTDKAKNKDNLTFINLTTFLGTTSIAVLLWKLVLLVPKLKPILSYRLAQLFETYESTSIEQSLWLIKVLENFLIAFVCFPPSSSDK